MTNQKANSGNEILESFKDLKDQKVVAANENSLSETIMKVFREYPTTSFTQRNFADKLAKRTQHINHVLTELRKKNLIIREGSAKQYYFRLNSE